MTTYKVRIDFLDWETKIYGQNFGDAGERAVKEYRKLHPEAEFGEDDELKITVTETVEFTARVFPLESLPHRGDVHTSHCCNICGCKYNDYDCTVATGMKKADYEHGNTSICYDLNW